MHQLSGHNCPSGSGPTDPPAAMNRSTCILAHGTNTSHTEYSQPRSHPQAGQSRIEAPIQHSSTSKAFRLATRTTPKATLTAARFSAAFGYQQAESRLREPRPAAPRLFRIKKPWYLYKLQRERERKMQSPVEDFARRPNPCCMTEPPRRRRSICMVEERGKIGED